MGKGRLAVIRLDVLRILEKQGRTKYWLYKQLGMSYQNFNRMAGHELPEFQPHGEQRDQIHPL